MSRVSRFGRMAFAMAATWLLVPASAAAAGPGSEAGAPPPSAYGDMRWRLIGPFRAGWATVASGVPGDPATWYFGGADGGVWKTRDAGVTWQPLFDRMGSASIGALTVSASDPRVIWVGTGQIQQRYDIVDGDGVYRSTDAGATWARLGLEDTRHIGAIWVDPHNADVAVVAALGHVFGANPQRGLYRTGDGGRHWDHVLDRGPDVGAVDIAGDPARPEILYASLWQVRRHPWLDYFQPTVGPGSGIVRSSDGGKSWVAVAKKGLPSGALGRIELAVVPDSRSRSVWAVIQTAEEGGGLYRSDDAGDSWKLINADTSLPSSYMSGLVPDPRDADILWSVGRSLRVSRDGGKTFRYVRGSPGGDDYHFLWIDPLDSRRMITAADQGAVLTLNGGDTWSSWYNQPTGQFYRLGVDNRFPYRIYSGQQDSGTVAIASRSDYGQLTFRDWHPVGGDERDGDHPDPANPDIVYGAGLGGRISRWDASTAQVQNVAPWPASSYGARPGTGRYRYDWITPLAISPRPPHAIYTGAQVLFRSRDAGRSWQTVSDDLTGADAKAKPCTGDVPMSRATRCGFGAIFAISPSGAADGLVWVGTDNGRVLLTRDDARSWTNVTPPGLSDWTRINQIDASSTDAGTATVAADGHRRDDYHPLAYRTHDYGAHWREIGRGLPAGAWVGVMREDPRRAGLLYAGTSRGVWVSFDDGMSWQTLQLNLPTTGINDMLVHGDDLIVATQGRAIWILDQLAPLRDLDNSGAPSLRLIRPGTATRLRENQNKDTPLPFEEPRGENPPVGAIIDYILPAGLTPPVMLEILDGSGARLRRFASDDPSERPKADIYFTESYLREGSRLTAAPGHHRFVWNLRGERPDALEYEYSIAAVPGREAPALPEGSFVLPGRYRLRLTAGGATAEQTLDVAMDPRCKTSEQELASLLEFQQQVGRALARTAELARSRREATDLLAGAGERSEPRLASQIARRKAELEALPANREEDPERANAVLASLATDLESADAPPTAPQRELLAIYEKATTAYEAKWKSFAAGPYAALAASLKEQKGAAPKP